jgi:integrase
MGNGMHSPVLDKDQLLHELKDPDKRRAFVEARTMDTIASQLRTLRTAREWEQADVAEKLGNRRLQPMVSRYENPDYGRYSVRTLLELAEVFGVALVVRFEPVETEGQASRVAGAAVKAPQANRVTDAFRSITWDEARRMLDGVDRRTAKGRRDYAILLLLVTYGLRVNDITRLTLDDIDWEHERILVPGSNAGQAGAYRLAGLVVDALTDYLQHGRPETTDRHLFMRTLAPLAPIGAGAVYSSVAHYLKKAGIPARRAGADKPRHTGAQPLMGPEFPLKQVGDYVVDPPSPSTQVYT